MKNSPNPLHSQRNGFGSLTYLLEWGVESELAWNLRKWKVAPFMFKYPIWVCGQAKYPCGYCTRECGIFTRSCGLLNQMGTKGYVSTCASLPLNARRAHHSHGVKCSCGWEKFTGNYRGVWVPLWLSGNLENLSFWVTWSCRVGHKAVWPHRYPPAHVGTLVARKFLISINFRRHKGIHTPMCQAICT